MFHRSIKWIMLVCGLLACSMFYAAVAPDAALRSSFGQTIEGPVAQITFRNWGALLGLMSLLLICGAVRGPARRLALLFVGASKAIFIGLIPGLGQEFLQFQVGVAVVVDTIMVVLFAAYLASTRPSTAPAG